MAMRKDNCRLTWLEGETMDIPLSEAQEVIQEAARKKHEIEAARKVIVREMKRKGKLWIRIFPHKPYTKKPAEVGMGKGKGDVEGYVAESRILSRVKSRFAGRLCRP